MATNNEDILSRLQKARTVKEKKAPAPKKPGKPLQRSTPVKKGGKPNGRSEKMRGVMAAIKPLYVDFLEKKPVCEIHSPVCTQAATCVHHTAGRGVAQIINIKTWKASCDACNCYVEKHDAWAREKGFKISKHTKENG